MPSEYESTELEQNLSLRDYLDILNKRRLTVLTVFLIVFVIAMIMALSKETPLFTSTSTILLERNFSTNNQSLGASYYWDPEFLPTQTEIIKSKRVALRVVDNLQLDTRYRSHFLGSDQIEQSFVSSIKSSVKTFFTSFFDDDNEVEQIN